MTRKDFQPIYFRADNKAWYYNHEIVPISQPLTLEQIQGFTGRAPKGGFDIVRVPYLSKAVAEACKGQGRILAYLFEHRIFETNYVDITSRGLAERTDTSLSTVGRLIDKLEGEGLLVQHNRRIWVNPRLIHKGDSNREDTMFDAYDKIMQEAKKGDYTEKKEATK